MHEIHQAKQAPGPIDGLDPQARRIHPYIDPSSSPSTIDACDVSTDGRTMANKCDLARYSNCMHIY